MKNGQLASLTPKKNRLLFILLGLLVFILLIFPNNTGAQDTNMLAVFEIDEFAQYPHLIRMLTVGDSCYQSLRNFVVYLHYFYGYPFYFFSALAVLPVRLFFGVDWVRDPQTILVVLRQLITVLPMVISLGFWLVMSKAFSSTLKTVLGFLGLVSMPAVFDNFFWWHPDSLAFLFVTLTFFFLMRDSLKFRGNFWWAAVAAGLAIGTKHLGEFFVLTIPVYLLYAVRLKKITWKKAILLAAGFVAVMLAAIIISNPLLLLPIERGEIIRYQLMQWRETTQGSLVAHPSLTLLEFFSFLNRHAITWPVLLLSGVGFYMGLRNEKNRLFFLLLLSYLLPYGLVIFGGSSLRPNYLIPFFIPFVASLLLYVPTEKHLFFKSNPLAWLMTFAICWQVLWFIPKNVQVYQHILNREKNSASIQFYDQLAEKIPPKANIIFRDWQIYIPEDVPYQVHFEWDNATYARIETLQPDLIVLEQSRMQLFSQQDAKVPLSENVNGEEWYIFYSDALHDRIDGYSLLYADPFAKAFVKNNLP